MISKVEEIAIAKTFIGASTHYEIMEIRRFSTNPLITSETDESIGENINGPSVIKTPDWLSDPLGEYYLYFAHHDGSFIRLAYADDLQGP